MSKNTAKVAQAISLLSDVLTSEVEFELNEDTETVDDEYDELKEQALDFSKDLAADLSIINDDLDRILDSVGDADVEDGDWNPLVDYEDDDAGTDDDEAADAFTGTDVADAEAEDGSGEVDISDTEDAAAAAGAPASAGTAVLFENNAALEKNNEELTDKIEDLTDSIRAVATQIENLHAAADTFVSEVEAL